MFDPQEVMIMPETKAISSAMASFLFIEIKFDLQRNAFFSEKVSYLQRILKNTALRPFDGPQGPQAQGPSPFVKSKALEPVERPTQLNN